jgi:hypothetical protein
MFRKILMCAVLTSPFIAASASAGSYETSAHAQARPRPVVLKGYYGADVARRPLMRSQYAGNIRSYRPAAPWHAYAREEAAYVSSPGYVAQADIHYTPPVMIYSQAPATPYAHAPIRVYYITQHEPYYNVPPYAVQVPSFGN